MRIKLIAHLDMDSGDYELEFHNVSRPGEGIDYWRMCEAMRQVWDDFERKVDEDDETVADQVYKEVH